MSPPLAKAINNYLRKRGSPMAGHGAEFVRAGTSNGVDPRLLVGIATIESGAGEHMKLAYNPFNWGVHRGQTFSSWSEALDTVARGLRKNYIAAGLTTPEAIVNKYAPASDGNDTGNWAKVVSEVMSQLGGGPGAVAPAATTSGATPQVAPLPPAQRPSQIPQFSREAFDEVFKQRILSGEGLQGRDLSNLILSSFRVPSLPPTAPGGVQQNVRAAPGAAPGGIPTQRAGKKIILPTKTTSTHPTSGLSDEGFTHAEDIMGGPGTPVGAPTSGVVVRLGSAQGGGSMYFRGDDGRMYWIGHIENQLPPGTRVKRGQVLAQISADHPRPHVHVDWSTSYGG